MGTIENIVGGMYLCLITPVVLALLVFGKIVGAE